MTGAFRVGELRVVVDGAPLAEEAAREFWRRFSDWMEQHVGDLAGFAAAEGLASVKPEVHGGRPVLVASRTAPQSPYTTAVKRPDGAARGGTGDGAEKGPAARPGGPKRGESRANGSKGPGKGRHRAR